MQKHISRIFFCLVLLFPLVASAQSDSASAAIVVPNVFTPNYDGLNDVFQVKLERISNFNCTVFNRYGVKIYEWNALNGNWDGTTTSGMRVPDGVYFYVIEATGADGKSYTEKGFVQVLR